MSGTYPDVSLNISSGLTLTNVQAPLQTVDSGLTAISAGRLVLTSRFKKPDFVATNMAGKQLI